MVPNDEVIESIAHAMEHLPGCEAVYPRYASCSCREQCEAMARRVLEAGYVFIVEDIFSAANVEEAVEGSIDTYDWEMYSSEVEPAGEAVADTLQFAMQVIHARTIQRGEGQE